jgi:hypothetical protein
VAVWAERLTAEPLNGHEPRNGQPLQAALLWIVGDFPVARESAAREKLTQGQSALAWLTIPVVHRTTLGIDTIATVENDGL